MKLKDHIPLVGWASQYNLDDFRSDSIAGFVVLFITVPQVIAYAFLAGLPPEMGLYAAIAALLGYAAFGSSRSLAVGPTAILAMMTLEATASMAVPGSEEYISIAIKLSFMTGLVLIALRLINFGAVINFLSHAVVTGFISAAAILIITNQLPAIAGMPAPADHSLVGVISHLAASMGNTNAVVLSLSIAAIILLVFCRTHLESILLKLGFSVQVANSLVRSAPMYAVALGIIVTSLFALDTANNVPVVGAIPTSLPGFEWVEINLVEAQFLLPTALLMAMVIFMESTSVGSAMASKKREKIEPNQELVGLGVANVGASLMGGFPVAGSFARTVVNFSSGAVTPVASLVTALLVVAVLLWFTPLFTLLPRGILAAIIVISAWQLIDVQVIRRIYTFNFIDAVTFTGTFLAVLSFGVESGIFVGIIISFVLLIHSASRPHIAVVGRVGDSEQFRNVERFDTKTSPEILAVRVDQSIYFVNTRYIENFIFGAINDSPEIKHIVLICTATNFIDTSGLELLERLCDNLNEIGITLHLAEVKSPVMDKLRKTDFYDHMRGEVYFTTDIAIKDLTVV